MGLLDDAIREHLELKRRGGADPGEIAHKEHEALAPVFPDEEALAVADQGEPPPMAPPAELPEEAEPASPEAPEPDPGPAADRAGFTQVGQETAELDMRSVLDEHDGSPVAPVAARSSDREAPPEEIPGQERLTFE
jgi:hypothetical protein